VAAELCHVDVGFGEVKEYTDALSAQTAGANGAHRMKEALSVISLQYVGQTGQLFNVPPTLSGDWVEYKADVERSSSAALAISPIPDQVVTIIFSDTPSKTDRTISAEVSVFDRPSGKFIIDLAQNTLADVNHYSGELTQFTLSPEPDENGNKNYLLSMEIPSLLSTVINTTLVSYLSPFEYFSNDGSLSIGSSGASAKGSLDDVQLPTIAPFKIRVTGHQLGNNIALTMKGISELNPATAVAFSPGMIKTSANSYESSEFWIFIGPEHSTISEAEIESFLPQGMRVKRMNDSTKLHYEISGAP
jgi:hypothetical protein